MIGAKALQIDCYMITLLCGNKYKSATVTTASLKLNVHLHGTKSQKASCKAINSETYKTINIEYKPTLPIYYVCACGRKYEEFVKFYKHYFSSVLPSRCEKRVKNHVYRTLQHPKVV